MSDATLVPPAAQPAQDAKPKESKGRTRTRSRSSRAKPSLEAPLRSLFLTAGEVWSLSDDVCGPALVEVAPKLAKAIDTQAKESPETYEFWAKILGQGSTVGVLVTAMPFVQVVMLHHLVPAVVRFRERREQAFTEPEPEPIDGAGLFQIMPEDGNPFVGVPDVTPEPEPEPEPERVNPNEYASD